MLVLKQLNVCGHSIAYPAHGCRGLGGGIADGKDNVSQQAAETLLEANDDPPGSLATRGVY